MKRRGITLLEMMITVVIVGLLSIAVARAFTMGIDYETRISAARERIEMRDRIDDRLVELFKQAYLSPDNTDDTTFFIGGAEEDNTVGSGNASSVQFTVQGERLRGALLASEQTFEDLNRSYGPQGGTAEIALSVTPTGDAGNQEGLFIRTQRPSDSEPTQGGKESLLDPAVDSIEFEFWDGTAWQPSWSTEVGATKRLPAAVRITYTLKDETQTGSHVLVVKLPNSDVTAENPAEQTAPTGGGQ